MSTIKSGQVGQFKGKIGALVVVSWRGILTGRSRPRKSDKPASDDQQDHRKKFGTVAKLLKYLSEQIAIGWASRNPKKTAMNEAVQYHFNHAITGEYPDYRFDCTKLLISRGRGIIDGGFRPVAHPAAEWSVEISWVTSNSTSDITQPTDRLTIVCFDENIRPGRFGRYVVDDVAERSDLKGKIKIAEQMKGHAVHVYMFFVSQDGKRASKSEYLGLLTTNE